MQKGYLATSITECVRAWFLPLQSSPYLPNAGRFSPGRCCSPCSPSAGAGNSDRASASQSSQCQKVQTVTATPPWGMVGMVGMVGGWDVSWIHSAWEWVGVPPPLVTSTSNEACHALSGRAFVLGVVQRLAAGVPAVPLPRACLRAQTGVDGDAVEAARRAWTNRCCTKYFQVGQRALHPVPRTVTGHSLTHSLTHFADDDLQFGPTQDRSRGQRNANLERAGPASRQLGASNGHPTYLGRWLGQPGERVLAPSLPQRLRRRCP